jgi:hypothetical protein
MAESIASGTPSPPQISFNIPNVTQGTKVSELTVGQLIELLFQINPKLPLERKMPDPQTLQAAFKEVHDVLSQQNGDSGIQDLIRQMQQGILEKAPDLARQTAAAPKDGGPGPHATQVKK